MSYLSDSFNKRFNYLAALVFNFSSNSEIIFYEYFIIQRLYLLTYYLKIDL